MADYFVETEYTKYANQAMNNAIAGISTVSELIGDSANAAKVDRSEFESEAIDAANYTINNSDYNSIISGYYNTPFLDELTKKEYETLSDYIEELMKI